MNAKEEYLRELREIDEKYNRLKKDNRKTLIINILLVLIFLLISLAIILI